LIESYRYWFVVNSVVMKSQFFMKQIWSARKAFWMNLSRYLVI